MQDHQESTDEQLAERIIDVGGKVGSFSDRPKHPFRFVVLQGKELQAYSFPGRTIAVTDGLMNLLASDDELAFVLAHEVAHVALRHHISQLRMRNALYYGGGGGKAMLETVQGLFDRDSEIEADRFGILYAVRADFAYSSTYAAFERIGGSTHGRQQSSRHPAFSERIDLIKDFRKELDDALGAFKAGTIALKAGNPDVAIDNFHLFTAEFPRSVQGLINLGGAQLARVHRDAGSPDGLAVVLLPILNDPGIRLRGLVNLLTLNEAQVNFQRALDVRPDEALAEAGLGLVDTRRRRFDAARYHLEQARQGEPFNPDFTLCLGNVEYMDGNYAVAASYYEKALEQKPGWPEAKKNLDMANRMVARAANPV